MPMDIVLNRLINGTHCLPCFKWLVLSVSTAKIHFKEQALAVGTKQSNQAGRADKTVGPACFTLGPLVWILYSLAHLELSTFHIYLWVYLVTEPQSGVNLIKHFWSKVTHSFCKLDHFIAME